MATFESLRPRVNPYFAEPEDDADTATFSPIGPSGTSLAEALRPLRQPAEPQPPARPGPFFPDSLPENEGEDEDDEKPQSGRPVIAPESGSPAFGRDALQTKGVNWADGSYRGTDNPRLTSAWPGFYEPDYDPEGKVSGAIGQGRDYVMAANVFGKQFSRDELMKDSEGRRLVTLMEARRTGAHRDEGFWNGLLSFKDVSGSKRKILADIPFLGWMVDGGMTVGETIDVSSTMKKMQRGEQVTNHEALAVRRYMLQQEMEAERNWKFQVGSLIHSSIPFMVEMAMSGKLIAAAAAAGAAVGGPVGAVIAGVGALVFGGAARLFTKAGRASLGIGRKAVLDTGLRQFTTRTFAEGFAKADVNKIMQESVKASGMGAKALVRAADAQGRERAMLALSREAAIAARGEAAVAKWTDAEFLRFGQQTGIAPEALRKRSKFETLKYLSETYADTISSEADTRLARYLMIEGDAANLFDGGLETAWKTQLLAGKTTSETGYFAQQRLLRQEAKKFFESASEKELFRNAYVNGVVEAGTKGARVGQRLPMKGVENIGSDIIRDSMSRTFGGVGVNSSVSTKVANEMADRMLRSLELQYGGSWFGANAGRRFARWFADGALDGMLRWDMSIFGGVGTLARSGTALGGKMAALKEAAKIAFVEAPVRGAMQLSAQTPLWPVASMASGHGPTDFAVRGQLGIQAQALMTGDEDLMNNARALAFGAGLVEYASENAGRGINLAISGAVKPIAGAVLDGMLPEATKDLGSWLSKKIAAVYGSETLMKEANRTAVSQALYKNIGKRLTDLAKENPGATLPSVSFDEVKQLVANRSAKGLTGMQAFMRATGATERELVTEAMRTGLNLTKTRTAITYFTAYYMLKHGLTPQKMATMLERVGYDGVVGEMLEERYGGFFTGLFGWNERPSDATFADHWSAAMDGLFPDKKQLVVEALGFAFPAVSHMSMNALYAGLGHGFTAKLREASNGLSHHMGTLPTLSIGGLSAGGAAMIKDWQKGASDILDRNFGTEEENRGKASGKAERLFADIRSKAYSPAGKNIDLKAAKSAEELKATLAEKADMLVKLADGDAKELERLLAEYDAPRVFGTEGVEAIRNMARRRGMEDDASKAVFAEDGEYGRHMRAGKDLLETLSRGTPATVNDAAADVTLQLPALSSDTSMVADETGKFPGTQREARVNEFSDDVVGDFARHLDTLAKASFNYQFKVNERGSWWSRHLRGGLMRFVGIANAIQTGDLAMAARNPVQWAMQDAGLPADLMNSLASLKKDAIMVGRQRVIESLAEGTHERGKIEGQTDISDFDNRMLERFEKEGDEYYRGRIQELAHQFLSARNVLSASRSDLTEQALRVVADKRKADDGSGNLVYGDAKVRDFHDPKFADDPLVKQEVEKAKNQIVGTMAQLVTQGAIAYNTHAGFGLENVTEMAFDYNRAMKYGTDREILAAIRRLPAFRALHPVHDLSYGAVLGDDFGGAAGRVGDVDTLIHYPEDSRLWTEQQMRDVLVAMGRTYGMGTAAENARAAETWLRRMKIAVAQQAPVAVLQGGEEVDATFSQTVGKDGRRVVSADIYDERGIIVAHQDAPDYVALARSLQAIGYDCQMPKVVLMEDTTFASKDATSMAQFLIGDRKAAREYFQKNFALNDEWQLPPYLRMKDGAWEFTEAEAAEKLRDELRAVARSVKDSNKLGVEGTGKVGDSHRWGYEAAARKYLEDRQIRKSATSNRFARTVVGEASYAVNPSGLPVGNTLFITSNYYAEGDGEALLRSALGQAIYHSLMSAHAKGEAEYDQVSSVYREMDAAFASAADEIEEELRERDPEAARRIRAAMDDIGGDEAGRLSPRKLAAMAASMIFFTSDRGITGEGNGYLLSPELALVADRARTSKWAPLFFSALDRALGGTGLFGKEGSYTGLQPLIDAFSPTSQEIDKARSSALFTGDETGTRKADIQFPEIKWTYEPGEGGGTILSPTVSATVLTGLVDVERGGFVRAVAENCKRFSDAFEQAVGRELTDAELYQLMKQSDAKGGETAETGAKPRIASAGSRTVSVNGVHHTIPDDSSTPPLSADIIDDETAFAVARSMRFLSPRYDMRELSVEQGRVAAREARDAIVDFLLARGMSVGNINRVLLQTRNAFGADERVEPDTDDAEGMEDALESASEEGNAGLAQEGHASNAVVASRDLIQLSNQLRYVFPSEGGNYTAVLTELAEELYRVSQEILEQYGGDVKQAAGDWEYLIGRYFNVLRWPRHGNASSEVALSQPWDDNAVTDQLLDMEIRKLHESGRDAFAFALSAIRNMDAKGKRRTQALRQMATMDQHDVNEVSMTDMKGSLKLDLRPNVTGGRASLAAVRAVMRHIVNSPTLKTRHPAWSVENRAKELAAVIKGIWALNNDNGYRERNFAERWGAANNGKTFGDALTGKSVAEFDAKIARAAKDGRETVAKMLPIIAKRHELTLDEHRRVVAFAQEYAARCASVADAIDYVFGADNEICRALRSREIVAMTVRDIEDKLDPASGIQWRIAQKMLMRTMQDFLDTGRSVKATALVRNAKTPFDGTNVSVLFDRIAQSVLNGATVQAIRAKGVSAPVSDKGRQVFTAIAGARVTQKDLLDAAMAPELEVVYYHTNLAVGMPKGEDDVANVPFSKFMASYGTISADSRSSATRILERFGQSLPRSTARLAGQNSDDVAESASVTAVTPSPEPVQDRIIDSVFARLKVGETTVKEQFLRRGRRFEDGTRLVTVCAGAKMGDAVVDKAYLSMLVYRANRERFENGDSRVISFEIYHGEKPTVLSLNIPWYVANAMLADIAAGEDYTKNRNLAKILEEGKLPASLKDMELADRPRVYDALFSVLAKAGRFQYINTKRTQVILSNATPVPAHRDYIDFIGPDGKADRREASSVNRRTGEKVVPGMHVCLSLAGADATQDMGMYFQSGYVSEGQRKLQSNPKAISQKNHGLSRDRELLMKGQAHNIGLGIFDGEMRWTTGSWRAAQRRLRRKVERVLGLDAGVLELPDDAQRADQEYLKKRAAALADVEEFLRHSSVSSTDHETQKCGPLAAGQGFRAEEGGAIHARINGKDVWVRIVDGAWQGKTDEAAEFLPLQYRTVPEYKGGAYAIALVVPAMLEALGLDHLDENEVFDRKAKTGIESDWIDAAGNETSGLIGSSGIFHSLGTAKGDKLSFWKDEDGEFECDFFLRDFEAQVMANSDAPSKLSHEHPAATNFQRDVVANAARAGRGEGAAQAVTASRLVPYLLSKAYPAAFEDQVLARDAEFRRLKELNPNSEHVRLQYARKRDSLLAKLMRAYVNSTHAVLCGSGIKCSFGKNPDGTTRISYEYSAGVTQYDKDTFQPARTVPKFARGVMGSNRTYSTMRANISGDGRFRYGWHIDMAALTKEIQPLLQWLQARRDAELEKVQSVYRAEQGGLFLHPDADNVDGTEIAAMANFATLAWAAEQDWNKPLRKKAREALSHCCVDYTGKRLADNPACNMSAVAFDDLFRSGRQFDYAAFECGSHKRTTPEGSELQGKTLFVGGSFFSGDRRPSGNFEAAAGFARVQAPVGFDEETGKVGPQGLYILDPAMCKTQGADTDGDSTTGTGQDGRISPKDESFLEALFAELQALADDYLNPKNATSEDRHADLAANAREMFDRLAEHYPSYFETNQDDGSVQLSEKFNQLMGNVLVAAQGNNYRDMPTNVVGADGELADAGDMTDSEVLAIELNGMSSVGPSVMKEPDVKDGGTPFPTTGDLAELYKKCTGKEPAAGLSWDAAFKDAVNGLTGKVKPDLLSAYDHAMFSAEAADGSGARGVMVSIQAAIEHMAGYDSTVVRGLFPYLYEDVERSCVPFVARLDGISNALFDVVKDLFAPRCGWRKDMLNYLVARLMGQMRREYEAERNGGAKRPPIDAAWFFRNLVPYAAELHRSETSVAGLLGLRHGWNAFEDKDKVTGRNTFLGVFADHWDDPLVQLFLEPGGSGIAWSGEDVPDIVLHGTGKTRLSGDEFYAAFNQRITRICRSQAKLLRDVMAGEPVKAQAFRVGNAMAALRRLAPQAFAKATTDDERLALGEKVFGTLSGKSREDGSYRVGADILSAMLGNVLFGGEQGVEGRIEAMAGTIEDMREFDTLLEAEDALSPDSTFQRGGKKVDTLQRKIRESLKRRAAGVDNASIRLQYAQALMRLRDMRRDAEHPATMARTALRDMQEVGALAEDGDRDGYIRYCRANRIGWLAKTKGELQRVALAQMLVGGKGATQGLMLANFGYMQHLPGAVAIALGHRDVDSLMTLLSDYGPQTAQIVSRLVEEATRETGGITVDGEAVPAPISALFRLLRVDASDDGGHVDFMAKLGPEEAEVARAGFAALKAYKGLVWSVDAEKAAELSARFGRVHAFRDTGSVFPVGVLTGEDLADLMRIEIARTVGFDAANELEARGNIAQMFGDETDEMERWGAAASRNLAMRALLRLELSRPERDGMPKGFDLYRSLHNPDGTAFFSSGETAMQYCEGRTEIHMDELAAMIGAKRLSEEDYEEIRDDSVLGLIVDAVTERDSLFQSHEAADERDYGMEAQRGQPAPVSSPYAQRGDREADFELTPRTRIAGVRFVADTEDGPLEFDTFEEAMNWHAGEVEEAMRSDPAFAAVALAEDDLAWKVATALGGTGADSMSMFANKVVADTLRSPKYGETFTQWLVDADSTPESLVDPLAVKAIRDALHSAARGGNTAAEAGKPRMAPKVARPGQAAPSITMARMKRSGFLDFVKGKSPELFRRLSKNPVEAIRGALEKVFGEWGAETGVKVERVTRRNEDGKYLPVNLIRVTRKVKDRNGVHNVVTYISFGDAIPMQMASKEYMASMLQAINAAAEPSAKPMTMAELESMTEAQRLALANSLNLRVLGESRSRKCVTTDCLLAMTGLIRLSDAADYHTLFHEYFHQMLDFYRETGICTDADMAALTKRYRKADGTLDEEAAADAFAAYLLQDDPAVGTKLLADGAGDRDHLFDKFKRTAQAFLSGALAYNTRGVPVFMKYMISADFTEREMRHAEKMSRDKMKDVEKALLEEDFDYGFDDLYESPEATPALHEARLGVQNAMLGFRHGTTTAKDLAQAAQRFADELARPENRIVFEGVQNLYRLSEPPREKGEPPRPTPLEAKLRDESIPAADRMSMFMEEALKRFGDGTVAPEYAALMPRLMDVASWGADEITAAHVSLAESAARRIIVQTATVLGLDFNEIGADGNVKLNALGETLVSDRRVAELAVRLLQEGTKKLQERPPEPGAPRRTHASAADIVGTALMDVTPNAWGEYAADQAKLASNMFTKAAEDLRARAEALKRRVGTNVSEADQQAIDRMERDASTLEKRASLVERVLSAVARGEDMSKVIPAGRGVHGSLHDHVLQFLLDASDRDFLTNGQSRWKATDASRLGLDYTDRYIQVALDVTADAVAIAAVVRRWARENGVEMPAVGADVSLPENPVAPPAEGVMEPDVLPQVILQTPGSWLASDLHKRFAGTNLRDMMTDSTLQALTEESNRIARNIVFYFGANVERDAALNRIETRTSRLGLDNQGVIGVRPGQEHAVTSVAAVRGRLLGLVNLQAEQVGEKWTDDDINNVNMALQLVTAIMQGESLHTGYDISLMSVVRLRRQLGGTATAPTVSNYTTRGNLFHPDAVLNRYRGREGESNRPSNLDMLLGRMIEGLGLEYLGWDAEKKRFRQDGLYCQVLDAFLAHAFMKVEDAESGELRDIDDAEYWDIVQRKLKERGLVDTSETGKSVLTIPVAVGKAAWLSSGTYKKLTAPETGRDPALLDLDRVAAVIAADANRLHRAAVRSGYLRDHTGAALSSAARPGLFFEAGTGFHRLIGDTYANARSRFLGRPSADEVLRSQFASLQETIDRDEKERVEYLRDPATGEFVKDPDGHKIVARTWRFGDLPAFQRNADGHLENVSTRKVQFLGRLLGLGSRLSGDALKAFLDRIDSGVYTRENTTSRYGFDIRPDMTVSDLDRAIFSIVSTLLAEESMGRRTSLTASDEDGGLGYGEQDLIDLAEMNRRLGEKLMAVAESDETAKGIVYSMSDGQAFRTFGMTGSAKTAPERLMSMAESIVHAERFRGCVAQMLTTVSQDGTPNYVVRPTDRAAEFMPDEFWEATAKFVINKLSRTGEYALPKYDAGQSGVKNMQHVADAVGKHVSDTEAKTSGHVKLHLLPPDKIGADGMFEAIYCHSDEADASGANALVGGEAAGYMKQLFGTLRSPSRMNAWRALDRIMAYSKAASVGLSTFFAIATRFESPVAACGLISTLGGYTQRTADVLRRLARTKAGKLLGLEEDGAYLADFLNSLTSDDPAIRDMRILLDTAGMSAADPVQNPMDGQLGNIDSDIKRLSEWIAHIGGGKFNRLVSQKMAVEVRDAMRAAFHNPGEYAFSNILAGVKMAVVAQTLQRLRRECEAADRPFDPIRELRRHSAYIGAEIGGIQAERYAWLTPGMQRLLRLAMFSYNWTLGAWVAGTGEVVTDLLIGGHSTTPAMRQRALVRWLRMLGIVKVGVPMVAQLLVKALATGLTKFGIVGDPDDPEDQDPLAVERMPWFCFNNESKIGALSIDVTPILKLCGRSKTLQDIRLGRGAWPAITTVVGAMTLPAAGGIGGFLTGGMKGLTQGIARNSGLFSLVAGGALGRLFGKAVPAYVDTGRGPNTSGRRRDYIHFGKQSDEFWRWFTDFYGQATGKMSIPMQKIVEAFFGSTNGSNFGKKFDDMSLIDRIFTTSLDPNESAIVNWCTSFIPFSAASVAAHPDAGIFGMMAPVQMGMSQTLAQKRIKARLTEFAEQDRKIDVWSFPKNRKDLRLLCADIFREATLNGFDPKELLQSAFMEISSAEYTKLMSCLPREKDDRFDTAKAMKTLRALWRVNAKLKGLRSSLADKYTRANVDWKAQENTWLRRAVKDFLRHSRRDPWREPSDDMFRRYFEAYNPAQVRSVDVQQDRKGGEAFSNFLATDDVPDTLFGIPVVSSGHTEEDLEFFRRNPKAAGFYDLGDEEPPPEEPPPEEPPVQAAGKGGDASETFDTPIPDELRAKYDAWYAQLPKNLRYTGDYDLQGAWLEKLGRPDKYEETQNGHLDDYGKKPNHITFSTGSKWHDPKVPERAGGEWKQAEDGSWDFYPGTGNQASDDELEAYFGKYEKGNRVHRREVRRGRYPGIANNPGNVEKHERRSDKTLFDGEIGGGRRPRRFANFDDPVKGLYAMAAVLARRANDLERAGKPFTIGNYVPSYAPASENDVEGYIGNMVRYSGLGRDTALDRWNVDDMAKLLRTAVRFESGKPHSDWFTDEEYRAAAERLQEGAAD